MNDLTPVLVVIGISLFALVSIVWTVGRSRTLVDRWAAQNELAILAREHRMLRTGPFFFRHDKAQTIYYVTVRDRTGTIRHAWVRCGGWFLGLMSDAVSVKWAD